MRDEDDECAHSVVYWYLYCPVLSDVCICAMSPGRVICGMCVCEMDQDLLFTIAPELLVHVIPELRIQRDVPPHVIIMHHLIIMIKIVSSSITNDLTSTTVVMIISVPLKVIMILIVIVIVVVISIIIIIIIITSLLFSHSYIVRALLRHHDVTI